MHSEDEQKIKQQQKKQTGRWSVWVCWYIRTIFVSVHVYAYTQIAAVWMIDSSTKHLQMISFILDMTPVRERRPFKQPIYLIDVLRNNLYKAT